MKNLAIITLLFILSAQAEHHHHCHEKEFEKRGFSFTTLALQYAHKHNYICTLPVWGVAMNGSYVKVFTDGGTNSRQLLSGCAGFFSWIIAAKTLKTITGSIMQQSGIKPL